MLPLIDYYSLPENVRAHAFLSVQDSHLHLSDTVTQYNRPAPTDFIIRVLRAVEIANGLPRVAKIRVSRRMTSNLGLYYHNGQIALNPLNEARTMAVPQVALHELGHHWHYCEDPDYITGVWQRSISANDVSNNYERYYIANVKERIAESFALYMIDPSVLSEEKRKFFVGQGLQSFKVWTKEYDKLKGIPIELLK